MAALNPDALEQLASKTAREYDVVHNKLALPVRVMGDVWTEERRHARVLTFRVLNIYGQCWAFEGHLRWDKDGHPKPEVYGPGWTSFRETMGLRVGDQIVFYRPPYGPGPALPPHEAPTFVIGVKREIRLVGATISGHVTPN